MGNLRPQQNQAAVNAIRAAGATTQLILVEGTCECPIGFLSVNRTKHIRIQLGLALGVRRNALLLGLLLLTALQAWTTSSGNGNVFGAIRDPNNNVAIGVSRIGEMRADCAYLVL